MIIANNLCLSFGAQTIFDHVSFTINHTQRIGLVGLNGSGKSTLLKALMHPKLLDSGKVTLVGNKKIAYLPQEVILESTQSVFDEAFSAFTEITALQKEIHTIDASLATIAHDSNLLDRLAEITQRLAELNPHQAHAKTTTVLQGLGFSVFQMQQPVNQLSVGWKMRLVLTKLLLQDADFYLFDEPTNHLDIFTKDWFLQFLQEESFGFLLVCHERYFLDKLCTNILELESGKGTIYQGNYSDYEEKKEQANSAREQAYNQQQKEIKQKQVTIERFRASASKAKMAQSMEKALDKIERITLPSTVKRITINFPPPIQPGKNVLTVTDLKHSFDNKPIFEKISFTIERGEKVAVVAPNGGGKTTLFNVITKTYPCQEGHVTFGHNVTYAIFAQDQAKSLNPERTVYDEVLTSAPKKTPEQIRSLLGAFLFTKDSISKPTKVLSGGEKNRVSMVKVLLQDTNFLLLDEPTNHLDMQSKELLLKALQNYQGTILFVSHDHDFINHLATRILELTPHSILSYQGNYESYLDQKQHITAIQANPQKVTANDTSPNSTPISPNKELHLLQKESKKLEQKIEKLETEIAQAQEKFAHFMYGTREFIANQTKLRELESLHKNVFSQWEKLQTLIKANSI